MPDKKRRVETPEEAAAFNSAASAQSAAATAGWRQKVQASMKAKKEARAKLAQTGVLGKATKAYKHPTLGAKLGRVTVATAKYLADIRARQRNRGEMITAALSERTVAVATAVVKFGALRSAHAVYKEVAYKEVAEIVEVGVGSVERILLAYINDGVFYESDYAGRPLQECPNEEALKDEIRRYAEVQASKGRALDRHTLRAHLNEWEGRGDTVVTDYRLRRWLQELGFKYGMIEMDWSAYHKGPHRQAQVKCFLLQYNQALKEQAAGTSIIVGMDESYVDERQRNRRGWFFSGMRGAFPKGTGKRIVFMHAMTIDGLLMEVTREKDPATGVVTETVRARTDAAEDKLFTVSEANAEGMFQAKADYHATGPVWKRYFENALLPCVQAMYPGRKAYFLLDNASSHHVRTGDQFNPFTATKKQIATKLCELRAANPLFANVMWERTVVQDGVQKVVVKSIPINSSLGDRSYNNDMPNRDQLAEIAFRHIKAMQPSSLLSDLQQLAIKNIVELIFTVPYSPCSQPIEMVWGLIKGNVGRKYSADRKLTDVIDLIRIAYVECKLVRAAKGDDGKVPPNSVCNGMWNKTLQWINEFFVNTHPDFRDLRTPAAGIGHLEIAADSELGKLWASWKANNWTMYVDMAEAERLATKLDSEDDGLDDADD